MDPCLITETADSYVSGADLIALKFLLKNIGKQKSYSISRLVGFSCYFHPIKEINRYITVYFKYIEVLEFRGVLF